MGGHKAFGNLVRNSRGIITFILSPLEQKAFTGFFTKSPQNTLRRITENIPYVAPGILTAVLVYKFANDDFNKRLRKDPKKYALEQ